MGKLPYMQFYTSDWRTDPNLSLCSPATRGIWADLVTAMHELDHTGQITGTADQLARTSRCSVVEIHDAIKELKTTKTADVTERNGIFSIINRRMQREYKERLANVERVRRHRGNGSVMDVKRDCNGPPPESEPEPEPDIPHPPPGGGRRSAPGGGGKQSVFEFPDRLRAAIAMGDKKKPEAWANWAGNGERDEEIRAALKKLDRQSEPGSLEDEYRARISFLKAANEPSGDYDDEALWADLKYRFEKLGKWDELLARKILTPKGE
jgi:hypothetical protein